MTHGTVTASTLARPEDHSRRKDPANSPVIVWSYSYSGARQVQDHLAAGGDLACTQATGIVALCGAAEDTWGRVEGRPALRISRLAAASVQQLITGQLLVLLARTGKSRWCELATASPEAAASILRIFPGTGFACVHRSCLDVIRAGVRANPWGLQRTAAGSYLQLYPGNTVAALAAYWADWTEMLLVFEAENPHAAHRIRYEDVTAEPDQALASIRASLRLSHGTLAGKIPEAAKLPDPDDGWPAQADPDIPAEMIPQGLRRRIHGLCNQLRYPPPGG
jgi:hypothetical protein